MSASNTRDHKWAKKLERCSREISAPGKHVKSKQSWKVALVFLFWCCRRILEDADTKVLKKRKTHRQDHSRQESNTFPWVHEFVHTRYRWIPARKKEKGTVLSVKLCEGHHSAAGKRGAGRQRSLLPWRPCWALRHDSKLPLDGELAIRKTRLDSSRSARCWHAC